MDEQHEYESEPVGHVHALNPQITVQADVVCCTVHGGPPVVGVAVGGWADDAGVVHYSAALLEPKAALSLANAILVAVGLTMGVGQEDTQDRAVAQVMDGRDWDQEMAKLLGGGA